MENQIAIFAAGCFWGVETLFKKVPGVVDTEVGYIGGNTDKPTYEEVCRGETGHLEAVKVSFDPNQVSFSTLLKHFFKLHDPTQIDGQGNDIGTQYLSAIITLSDEQRRITEDLMKEIENKKIFEKPLATKILSESQFFSAEDYHQDYLDKNPNGYMCHFVRDIDL